jgi:PHD/YefM family antitoxin component YafN of YafNO toxin-antitoxin module
MAKKATLPKLLDQQFVVDRDGKRQAVIVPLKDYEQLMEDLHDLAVVAERRDEEPISLDDMKRRLREDGLI